MRISDFRHHRLAQVAGYALALGSAAGAGGSEAASAAATATATVVEPAVVVIVVPPAFPGTVVTIESYTQSLSGSGPVLRAPSPPPATSGTAGPEGGGTAPGAPTIQGAAGPGAAPPPASVAAVTVTRRADGALAVSGGSTLTFSVSEPGVAGTITIEYN